jgi:hypothetical protein
MGVGGTNRTFGPLGDDVLLERGDGARRSVPVGPDVGAVRQPELDLELLLDAGHLPPLGTRQRPETSYDAVCNRGGGEKTRRRNRCRSIDWFLTGNGTC